MRLIDADAMIDRLKEWDTKDKTDKALYNFTLNRINEQPTIQPEIVRCKDCEHGVLDDGFPHQYFCIFKGDEWNNADYFCGHAKRREVTT